MRSDFLQQAARRLKLTTRRAAPPAPAPPPVVLCADDDDSLRALCTAVLGRAGFRTDTARNGREALQRLEENDYAVVLLDLDMPYVHGATVLSILAKSRPSLLARLVVLTALPESAVADLAGPVGAILRKPVRNDTLVSAVRGCCDPASCPEIVGERSLTVHL